MSAFGNRWLPPLFGACLLIATALATFSASADEAQEAASQEAQAAVRALLRQNQDVTRSSAATASRPIRDFGWDAAANRMMGIGRPESAFSALFLLEPEARWWREVEGDPWNSVKSQSQYDELEEMLPLIQARIDTMRAFLKSREKLEGFRARLADERFATLNTGIINEMNELFWESFEDGRITSTQYKSYLDQAARLKNALVVLSGDDDDVAEDGLYDCFCEGLAGWTVVGDADQPAGLPTLVDHDYLQAKDLGEGFFWFWKAPRRYSENLCEYYGGSLYFEIKQSDPDGDLEDYDVVIRSSEGQLTYEMKQFPGTDWTAYQIYLEPGSDWKGAADAGQFRKILANASDVLIRGEYSYTYDVGGLNLVALRKQPGGPGFDCGAYRE